MKISIWGNELFAWTAAASFAQVGNAVFFQPDILLDTAPIGSNKENKDVNQTSIAATNTPASAPENARQEPELIETINAEQRTERLKFNDHKNACSSVIHILAFLPNEQHKAEALCAQLAQDQNQEHIIINISNFGIGATDKLQTLFTGAQQTLAYIPDQLPAGSAMQHFKQPDHLIVGCENDWALMHIRALFRPFSQNLNSWLLMSAREAEYTKFAITGMLALRLAYINDLANLADELDVDIDTIRHAMGADERIGQHYLSPGCGFGGEHFPQYIQGLAGTLSAARNSSLLTTVLEQNEKQKEQPFRKLWRYYDCDLQDKTISVWGLSFKPGTASISNAPSLKVIEALLSQGCRVQVHDPKAMTNIQKHFAGHSNAAQLIRCESEIEALENSHGLLLLTEWAQYASPDFDTLLEKMATPLIIDGRNVFDKELVVELGFTYFGIGR